MNPWRARPAIGALVIVYALKLLFPVLVVMALVFALVRPAFRELLGLDGFRRAAIVLALATVVAFLGHDLGIVMLALALVGAWAGKYLGGGVRGRLAAMVLIVLTMPPVHYQIDGFAGINRFVDLTTIRVLSLTLLTGLALRLLGTAKPARPSWMVVIDCGFFGYQLLKLALQFPHNSTTGLLRSAVETTLDILLPYYVFSRGIRSREDLRFILSHVAFAGVFAAGIACTESMLHRNLYEGLQWVYAYRWQLTLALTRGDHLRVQAMTAQPILLAFELIFTIGIWTYLCGAAWRRRPVLIVFAMLIAALIFTWSRGPWLGAIGFGLCLLGARKLPPRVFGALLIGALGFAVIAKALGADAIVMDALAGMFGGDAANLATIDYRRLLLDTAMALVKQSPWLGVPDYASQMQDLKQGEGIIDIVNSYVAIALDAGLIGLVLYLTPYVVTISRMLGTVGPTAAAKPDGPLGVAFSAVFMSMTVALLCTIFTTSTFAVMPFLLTLLVALPVARLSMPAQEASLASEGNSPLKSHRISFGAR